MATTARLAATPLCPKTAPHSTPEIYISFTQLLMHRSQLVSSWNIFLKHQNVIVVNKQCCLFPPQHCQLKQNSATLSLRAPRGVSLWPKHFPHFQYCQWDASATQCQNWNTTSEPLQDFCKWLLQTHTHTFLSGCMYTSQWLDCNELPNQLLCSTKNISYLQHSGFLVQSSLPPLMLSSFYS